MCVFELIPFVIVVCTVIFIWYENESEKNKIYLSVRFVETGERQCSERGESRVKSNQMNWQDFYIFKRFLICEKRVEGSCEENVYSFYRCLLPLLRKVQTIF